MTSIDQLLKLAVDRGASDLHLATGLPPALRIDGDLVALDEEVVQAKALESRALGMLSAEQKHQFTEERELDFAYQIDEARFRVNLHFEKGNVGLVARAIPQTIPTMEEIAMPEVVYDLARLDQGLVLMTGPTGHGKTTSLAAMVDLINKEKAHHIVTLEDPVEFLFEPKKCIIKQRELGSDMLSFSEGLKHVLRQDPNVVLVGELRDLETIATAITVAETGHLVLATLHTFNAAQTIDRIVDVFPAHQQPQVRLQVSMLLKGVISQRLLPKVGGGRVAAREILINTPAVATMIRDNKVQQIPTAMQTGVKLGMRTMDQELAELVSKGVIEKEIAARHMINPEKL